MQSERDNTQIRQWVHQTAAYRPLHFDDEWLMSFGHELWPPRPVESHDVLMAVLDKLPDTQRDVVEMRIWGRHTFDEIAETLGLASRGAAHVYWKRALVSLRKMLEESNDQD